MINLMTPPKFPNKHNINLSFGKNNLTNKPTLEIEEFCTKILKDLYYLSDHTSHLEDCLKYVKTKMKISSEYLYKDFIDFRDKYMHEKNEVLLLCLFYYIWVHENVLKSAEKSNQILKVIVNNNPLDNVVKDKTDKTDQSNNFINSKKSPNEKGIEEDEDEIVYFGGGNLEREREENIKIIHTPSKSRTRSLSQSPSMTKNKSPTKSENSLSPILSKMQSKTLEKKTKLQKEAESLSQGLIIDDLEKSFLRRKRNKSETMNLSIDGSIDRKKPVKPIDLNNSIISNKELNKTTIVSITSKPKSKSKTRKGIDVDVNISDDYRLPFFNHEGVKKQAKDTGNISNSNISVISPTDKKKLKETIDKKIQNDPKHNLIMKLAHKITNPENWEKLKSLIPKENAKIIEKALRGDRKIF